MMRKVGLLLLGLTCILAGSCDWQVLRVDKGKFRNQLITHYYTLDTTGTYQRRIIFGDSVRDCPIPTKEGKPYRQWNKVMYYTYKVDTGNMDQSCMIAWRKTMGSSEPADKIALTAYSWYNKDQPPWDPKWANRSLPFIGYVDPMIEYDLKIEKSAGLCTYTVTQADNCHLVGQVHTPQECNSLCKSTNAWKTGWAAMWYYGGQEPAPETVSVAVSKSDPGAPCTVCSNPINPDTAPAHTFNLAGHESDGVTVASSSSRKGLSGAALVGAALVVGVAVGTLIGFLVACA